MDGDNSKAHAQAVEGMADAMDIEALDEPVPGNVRGNSGQYLTDLADALRSGGLDVEEYDGWKSRAAKRGGYENGPLGFIIHHTASPKSFDGKGDAQYQAETFKDAPQANLYLDRQGKWWVLAAGTTNTNGHGGPLGPFPLNRANHNAIGIEAGNRGTGEPWSSSMQDSYVRGVAVLAEHYGIASSNVYSHIEWVTANFKNMKNLRRIDPAGPSRFGSINSADSWDMDKFRAEVEVQRGNASKATPPPKSSTVKRDAADGDLYVIKARDTWWSIADKTMGDPGTNWKVLADANGGEDAMLYIGGVLTIPGGVASSATAPKKVDFPGEAKPGDKGAVVLAWQEALIERGALNDTPGNRDSDFGTGTERIVRELKESWGWSDADGIADSKTWKRLHEAV